jgi:NAD(P)-dependent dehydrogenase (short-subunit alcohol dehydrogenase family)
VARSPWPPIYGPYAGTKFALEAVSDSSRREITPFGVQVVVVEPGAVQTKIAARAIATANEVAPNMTPEQSQRYGRLVQAITAQAASATESGLSADAACHFHREDFRVEPSRFPPRLGWPIARSPTTLTSAVLPALSARSRAGRNSSGRSTCSP